MGCCSQFTKAPSSGKWFPQIALYILYLYIQPIYSPVTKSKEDTYSPGADFLKFCEHWCRTLQTVQTSCDHLKTPQQFDEIGSRIFDDLDVHKKPKEGKIIHVVPSVWNEDTTVLCSSVRTAKHSKGGVAIDEYKHSFAIYLASRDRDDKFQSGVPLWVFAATSWSLAHTIVPVYLTCISTYGMLYPSLGYDIPFFLKLCLLSWFRYVYPGTRTINVVPVSVALLSILWSKDQDKYWKIEQNSCPLSCEGHNVTMTIQVKKFWAYKIFLKTSHHLGLTCYTFKYQAVPCLLDSTLQGFFSIEYIYCSCTYSKTSNIRHGKLQIEQGNL